jgi:hypothetical protein
MTPQRAELRPFIVTLSVPVSTFRETLTRAIPEAHLGQELPRGQVVVILPGKAAGPLAALPGVTAVARDELLTTLRHDQPGDSPG